MSIDDFLREDGSLLIPKEFVPFVVMKGIPDKKKCEECGEEFYPTHGSQRFCSPVDGIKRSRCENRYNQRLRRKRRKEKLAEKVTK